MNAQEYLQRAEAAGRVKCLARPADGQQITRVSALILDEAEGIAVVLDDGTAGAGSSLRPGQVVKYAHAAEFGGPVVLESVNLRGDAVKAAGPATDPQAPLPATPAPPPAVELRAAREAAAEERRQEP